MKIWLKSYFGLLVIFMVFGIFASSYFFRGLIPFPSRYLVNHFSPWNAYSEFALPVKNAAMPDVIGQIYPWKKFTIETWKDGEIPLWNPYSFSGTPHLANYQSQVFSPTNILYFFLPFIDAWSIQILLQPLLAGIFMYLFARSLKQSHLASLVSSISFMFCGFITTWMAYGTLAYAILYLPLCLYLVERYLFKREWFILIFLSISVAFSFFSGHFQTSIYMYGSVLFYIAWGILVTKNVRDGISLLLSSIFGLMIAFPQILPSIEFYKNSVRETITQKMEVIPWLYFPTRIAPDFFGNPVTRNDWFGHYAEWNSYSGIIPFFLSFFVFLKKINTKIFFFILLFIISVLLSFDTPIVDLIVFFKIPLLSTSAASRIIVLSSFAVAILAGYGLDILKEKISFKTLLIFGFSSGLCILALWLVVLLHFLDPEKSHVARNNLILPTGFWIGMLGCIFLFLFFVRKKFSKYFLWGILLLLSFEMLRFAVKWMPFEERKFVYPSTQTTEAFKKLSSYDRFYLDTHAENALIYKLPISDGYDPLYYNRYGEFVKYIADGKKANGERSTIVFPKDGTHTKEAINLLGIRYIAYRESDGMASWAFPYWKYQEGQLNAIYKDEKYTIFENNSALGKVYFADMIIYAKSDNQILEKMFSSGFATRSAVVESEINSKELKSSDSDVVEIQSYKNNSVEIKTKLNSERLLILNDVLYPGWRVLVDGKSTEIQRVNYIFRGVFVPGGEHVIEFVYMPQSFVYGCILAIVGSIGVIILIIKEKRYGQKK